MERDSGQPRVMLGLADVVGVPLHGDTWIGGFLALGSYLRKYLPNLQNGRRLVVAVSVPRRDYVAALISAGLMLSAPAPVLTDAMEVFRRADDRTYIRAATDTQITVGRFVGFGATHGGGETVNLGGKKRLTSSYRTAVVLNGSCEDMQSDVPQPGFLGDLTHTSESWLQRITAPPEDVVLVGTRKWLLDDLEAEIGDPAAPNAATAPLANYVLPIGGKVATWATAVLPASRLAEGETLPKSCRIVVLDRYGAIRYLNDTDVPIVVCVVDRSVADDSSAELIVQARLANSRPISVTKDLKWCPPLGVEAMAFTVTI